MALTNVKKRSKFVTCCFRAPQVYDDNMGPADRQTSITAGVHAMSASSPRARKSLEPASDSAALRKLALKASATGRKSDQGLPAVASPQSLTQGDQPNLQHLMASNINRQYTDDDWFAAMSAISHIKQLQQLRALRSQNPSTDDDDVDAWFSPRSRTISTASAAFISDAERDDVFRIAHEIEQQEQQQQQMTVSLPRELDAPTSSCVPNPPLLFADENWKYREVDVKPFCFYWERDELRSTPAPLPIDLQMKVSAMGQKIHQCIPGTWFQEVGNQLLMHATPSLPGIPSSLTKSYTEFYNKDQSPNTWNMRRDVRMGKTVGQMYMTTDGLLILRICAYGMFGKTVEWIHEDYLRLEDNGETVVTRQVCKVMADNSVQSQFLIGRKAGVAPLKH